jgi:hypothetical protein
MEKALNSEYSYFGQEHRGFEIELLIKGTAKARYFPELLGLFCILLETPDAIPRLRLPRGHTLEQYLNKWVAKYFRGYDNRPSARKGNPSATVPDSLVREIFEMMSSDKGQKLSNEIAEGHSLMMTIENLIGDLLEEYLYSKLKNKGWVCCWGQTFKAVDFIDVKKKLLLQVKTSDNSENSSSVKVREGTTIIKWYRRRSRVKDGYCWDKLKEITGEEFSERDFRDFVNKTIEQNPHCLYISPATPEQLKLLE